ncbi:hypothetical protein BRADI_2g48061v3 [Brachypodium distachyon]|uniref:Uncharacterized protein n=1 Tax=Brachypodium distachyon TaxID=15368 RepID=A0A0Q3MYW3_BRADI|nr:hypothetical protein BRADI_2g48061v3 [Brachypodium distachyon]
MHEEEGVTRPSISCPSDVPRRFPPPPRLPPRRCTAPTAAPPSSCRCPPQDPVALQALSSRPPPSTSVSSAGPPSSRQCPPQDPAAPRALSSPRHRGLASAAHPRQRRCPPPPRAACLTSIWIGMRQGREIRERQEDLDWLLASIWIGIWCEGGRSRVCPMTGGPGRNCPAYGYPSLGMLQKKDQF